MRFCGILTEGEVVNAGARIIDTKNELVDYFGRVLSQLRFADVDKEYAEDVDDDAIVYAHAVRMRGEPQILMVRIVTDTDIQVQIPQKLARRIRIQDYYNLKNSQEVIHTLSFIKSSIR